MLIKNATLYTAVRAEPVQEDISLEHGKIKAMEAFGRMFTD